MSEVSPASSFLGSLNLPEELRSASLYIYPASCNVGRKGVPFNSLGNCGLVL